MARLPVPGGDDNRWGEVLNDYLSQSHNDDGSLKTSAVNASNPSASAVAFTPAGGLTSTNAQDAVVENAGDLTTHENDVSVHSSGRELAYAQITTNQAGLTASGFSIDDVTGLSISIPAGGLRPVYITAQVHADSDTASGTFVITIVPAADTGISNAVNGAYTTIAVSGQLETLVATARLPAGTSGDYKVGVTVASGTSGTAVASTIAPSFIKAVEA